MERTKHNRTPNLILTSDWHLREDTPTCWVGDFQEEQWVNVAFINGLQDRFKCPVIHAGDLFHHWKPSPWLLSKTMTFLPKEFYTIYGQHDLPQHSWDLRDKSGIHALQIAGRLSVMPCCHYGQEPKEFSSTLYDILVWHHLTYQTKPFPGAEGGMAAGILRKYPQYYLIVTGDNHQSFTEEYQGRRLVNPGNITRQTADQIDFQPRVALWFAEDNSIEWVNLPRQEGVISRDHQEKKEERDGRIDAFVSGLNSDWKAKMSFEDNLREFFQVNTTRDSVKQIIYNSLD